MDTPPSKNERTLTEFDFIGDERPGDRSDERRSPSVRVRSFLEGGVSTERSLLLAEYGNS